MCDHVYQITGVLRAELHERSLWIAGGEHEAAKLGVPRFTVERPRTGDTRSVETLELREKLQRPVR